MGMKTLKKNIKIDLFSLLDTSDIITEKACLFQVSHNGFYLRVHRKDLLSSLKKNLSLKTIQKRDVTLHIPDMNIHLDGIVAHTRHIGKGVFEVFIKFFDNVPKYWRHCLLDMLCCYPDGSFSQLDTCPKVQPGEVIKL